jgi:hypothetical protein
MSQKKSKKRKNLRKKSKRAEEFKVEKISQVLSQFDGFPIWKACFLWAFVGTILLILMGLSKTEPFFTPLLWFYGLWGLGSLNLYFLMKTALSAFQATVNKSFQKNSPTGSKTLLWGMAKLSVFVLIGVSLFLARSFVAQSFSSLAVVLGISTMLIVPLLGGFWWAIKDERH